jgi:PAS domain S-box-containing protein
MLLFFGVFVTSFQAAAALGMEEAHRILFVSSYHPAFQSFLPQVRGLRAGLREHGCGPDRCALDVEFMDTKRFPGPENVVAFRERLSQKLERLPKYEVVVVGDDNALTFALAERDGLFAGHPIVFHGINNLNLAVSLDADPSFTGIVEAASVRETLDVIKRLTGADGDIFVITDQSPSAQAVMEHFLDEEEIRDAYRLQILSTRDYSYEELYQRLSSLPLGSAALFVSAARDRVGHALQLRDFMTHATGRASVPIYTLWHDNLGLGVLGGKLVDPYHQGRESGRMVATIVAGRPISEIRLLQESPNIYAFDWRVMQRFDIDADHLPEGSVVIERPKGIWETHSVIIVSAAVLIFVLGSATSILMFYTLRLKRLQSNLRSSEMRFRDYSDSSSDYYWEMDEHLRFSFFSERFTLVSGVSSDDLLGKTREETGVPPGVSGEKWDAHLHALRCHAEFRDFVHARQKPDGAKVWLAINGKPIFGEDGRFMGYRGTGRDVTKEWEAQEKQKELRERADEANRAKSEFLANMSHDLRTPLNAILGYAEIIQQQIFGPVGTDRYAEYIDYIHKCGLHLSGLINDILDLSRIESGEYQINEEWIDVREEIAEACQRCNRPMDAAEESQVTIEVGPAFPYLYGDKRSIAQIIDNLLTNAIKYAGLDAGITIGWSVGQDGWGELSVSDTGVGIPPDQLEKLTEPFYQGGDDHGRPHTVRRVNEGYGLGLSIVSNLVDMHGARFVIESEIGVGSSFRVRFPAHRLVGDDDGQLPAQGAVST